MPSPWLAVWHAQDPTNSTTSQVTDTNNSVGSQEVEASPLVNNNSSQSVNRSSNPGSNSFSQASNRQGKQASSVRAVNSWPPQGRSTTSQANSAASQRGNNPSNQHRARANPPLCSSKEPNPKWVINLSSKPLTQVQRSVLAMGPNFVVSHRHQLRLHHCHRSSMY